MWRYGVMPVPGSFLPINPLLWKSSTISIPITWQVVGKWVWPVCLCPIPNGIYNLWSTKTTIPSMFDGMNMCGTRQIKNITSVNEKCKFTVNSVMGKPSCTLCLNGPGRQFAVKQCELRLCTMASSCLFWSKNGYQHERDCGTRQSHLSSGGQFVAIIYFWRHSHLTDVLGANSKHAFWAVDGHYRYFLSELKLRFCQFKRRVSSGGEHPHTVSKHVLGRGRQ